MLSVVSVELAYCIIAAPDQTINTVVLKFHTNAIYNKWGTYVGMDWSPLSWSLVDLGTVPVLFVFFFLICHPYMSVILEQNVFILVCVLLCYVRYVYSLGRK